MAFYFMTTRNRKKKASVKRRKRRTGTKTKKTPWNPRLLWLIPIGMLLLSMILIFRSLRAIEVTTDVQYSVQNQRTENTYDMSRFRLTDGIGTYEDEDYTSRFGVDVSYHNEDVDFAALKKAGVSFVMIRCGYRGYTNGTISEDEKFREYIQAAEDAGLDAGVYFFSQAVTAEEAAEEARFVLEEIRSYNITMPVVYDNEIITEDENARGNAISIQQRTDDAVVFLENIRQAGYTPMLYASTQTYDELYDYTYLNDYDTWIAQYESLNTYPYAYSMWQYSDAGIENTALAGLDLDIQFIPKAQATAAS